MTLDSLPVSTYSNLTRPPPPLLPFFTLAAPANTLVSLLLHLMKAIVLTESSFILHFHWILYTTKLSTYMIQVSVTLFPSF